MMGREGRNEFGEKLAPEKGEKVTMGEVVGMAASICKKYSTLPRNVYQHHLPELKDLMKKGTGKPAEYLPDNQKFNLGGNLKAQKNIIFTPK